MGDNLAQELYAAFRANVDPERPSWGNLPSLEREAWEVVATRARQTMAKRFVADVRAIGNAHQASPDKQPGAAAVCSALLAGWER